MTSPRIIPSAKLPDRKGIERTVHEGDFVEVVPAEEGNTDYDEEVEFLEGKGPFKIHKVTRWPCGKVMLYLETKNRIPGTYTNHLRYVGE
jgi:hypothetical protein